MPSRPRNYGRAFFFLPLPLLVLYAGAASVAESRLEYDKQIAFDDRQALIDRRNLILPSAKDFIPSPTPEKVRLRLSLAKRRIRASERVSYRLDLINEGSKKYIFIERPSFFKTGRLPGSRITVILKEPSGSTVSLRSPIQTGTDFGGDEIRFPAGLTEAQKRERFETMRRESNADSKLLAKLMPGESVRTRGDAQDGAYRSLVISYEFLTPGVYELHAELDGLLKPGQPSNTVRFEVVP